MASPYLAVRSSSQIGDATEINGSSQATQSLRGSTLSTKITGVLSTSYADSDIRDALALLDKRGLENTAETRRQLRLDAQREVLESNGDIIREFGQVAEQLKRIRHTIGTLNKCCKELKHHVTASQLETAPILEEASELIGQKSHVEDKQMLLRAFQDHYLMSEDDLAVLTSTAEPVNDNFFIILARAKRIQNDCELLLGTENQRLGLEIMEQVSKNVNGAFQKLYRWIQREFKSLNLENPQISSSIRRALRVLAERPSLFQNCLDFFAEARENILSDAFYTALTGTSVGGKQDTSIKPIELVAHDPLRYVGDMLAWTHSATVSEREALEVLFISEGDEIAKGIQAGRNNEPWNREVMDQDASSEFNGLKALNEVTNRDVAGVSKVLRQRIGQVIQNHEEIIMAYKIANLLNFYCLTFERLLGAESTLLSVLKGLDESAIRQFRVLVRDHIANLHAETLSVPSDLEPPDFLHDGLKQLTAIMRTYESSMASASSREKDFQPTLEQTFDPLMAAAESMARELEMPAKIIYLTNCLLVARNILAPFDFTDERVSKIELEIQGYSADLVESQYSYFRNNSGIQPLLQALAPLSDSEDDLKSLRSLEVFRPDLLVQASQTLDDFLPSALMDAMENLIRLQSTKLSREITEEAATKFSDDFELIEEKLFAADGLWEQTSEEASAEEEPLRNLFPRTSGEIRVLLS